MNNEDGYLEKGLAAAAGVTETLINETHINQVLERYDDFYSLIFLLYRVADFQPPKKWITPILKSNECQDLRTQLLVAVEDYELGNKT